MAASKTTKISATKPNIKRVPRVNALEIYSADSAAARTQLIELEGWLSSNVNFTEVAQAIPEFDKRRHLCAAIGTTFGNHLNYPDRLSFELNLGGNYFPDLVVGDSKRESLVLVEFEGAEKYQIFQNKKTGQQYPSFSAKFQHGFFQLLDWMHRLKDASKENKEDWFTFVPKKTATVLVIGRDSELSPRSQAERRLDSLANSFTPDNNDLYVVTYDGLIETVKGRLLSSLNN
ncbi:Shedu anti-phage system protein SduA domain-containing protein [Achromobacter piechaudii]|uniref:Shedu protein SduA C-terminal domain-containing protein n=1 Tax=Achromobacter piechaudii TaxID=72556 RepID=A0A6S7DL32_9BURK|nr:Shedu anti-phage system protein SduA domain-containing protein [Achromobacter piechaudii]CAB3817634.1 hypothetical protein LMG1861_00081 [Achromobacter piechaudii]